MSKRVDWVSATEVASYVYCPEAWRLEHGLKHAPANLKARRRGEVVHQRWQRTEQVSSMLIRVCAFLLVAALLLWLLQSKA